MKQPSRRSEQLPTGLVAWLFICFSMGFMLGAWTNNAIGIRAPNFLSSGIGSLQHISSLRQKKFPLKSSLPAQPKASHETLAMGHEFYASNFSKTDTSTTIIFNVYQGHPKALELQLEAALDQQNVTSPDVWVMIFDSPHRAKYESVVNAIRAKDPERERRVTITTSDFNHKFHGRFLLAYMATTKYVLIVDDDRAIDRTTVYDYIQYMRRQKGVWGNKGHRRASSFRGYKSWPNIGYNLTVTDMAEQDYLCGMWFLEQTWLEYFMKERPPSWSTSEDMHLSHVMRKYLNLNTFGGKVALSAPYLPRKAHAATKGPALVLREYIFDHQLGRGNKVASVNQPIDTLVYAETAQDIDEFLRKLEACSNDTRPSLNTNPWCNAGRTAAVFRGAKEQDVNGLIAAAEKLCAKTACEYFNVKPRIRHGVRYFNMREGFGQTSSDVDIPLQTGTSDMMLSLVGILNNVLPETFFVPDVESRLETETNLIKRLQIYQRTVLLAVDIHRNSRTNGKVIDGKVKDEKRPPHGFPSGMKTLIWQRGSPAPVQYRH